MNRHKNFERVYSGALHSEGKEQADVHHPYYGYQHDMVMVLRESGYMWMAMTASSDSPNQCVELSSQIFDELTHPVPCWAQSTRDSVGRKG